MVNRLVSVGDDFKFPAAVSNATSARELAAAATGNDRAALQARIDAAAISGKPVSLRRNAGYQVNAPLTLASGVIIEGNGATIKALAGNNTYVITNADRVNGNTGIILRDLKVDGNAAGQTAQFNTVEFMRVTKSRFYNLEATGAQRNQMFPEGTNGDGLCLIYCHDNEINGGYFHRNTYDGIKLRSSNRNKIIAPTCEDNGRSGIQIAFYSPTGPPFNVGEGVEAEGSNDNIITGAVITHSTGIPHFAAPTTSGIYLHTSARNTITNFRIEGVQQGIGFYGGNRDNQFSAGVIRARYGAQTRASIDLENGTEYRNTFSNITVRPLSGANGKLLSVVNGAVGNRFLGCRFDLGDGTGTWTLANAGTGTQILDYLSDFPVTDTGAGTILRNSVPSAAASGAQFVRADSFTGASAAVPYGWQPRWNQTGAAWAENAGGYVQVVKTSTGRAVLACSVAGDIDDAEVLVKVRTNAKAAADIPVGVVLRGTGAAAAENGYFVALGEGAAELYSMRYAAGAAQFMGQSAAYTWPVNTWVWIRARVTGTGASVKIQARSWVDGGTEPSTWAIDVVDTSGSRITGSGFHGLFASTTAHTSDCDYYEVRKV